MQIINKFNKSIRFLLCVIDIFSKYAWMVLFKDEKGTTVTVFQKFLDESSHKQNTIRVDKGCEFYNKSMKSCLLDNDIKMYSTHKENMLLLKDLLEPYRIKFTNVTSILKNVCIDK